HEVAQMCRARRRPRLLTMLGIATIPGEGYSLYTAPLLTAVEAALLALGLAMLLRRWRNPAAMLLVLSAAGVVFVGGMLIPPQPAFNHWTPGLAIFYAILAAPLAGLLAASSGLSPPGGWSVPAATALPLGESCAAG